MSSSLVIFDTCDVMYDWSISLLPPIVLDNLFAVNQKWNVHISIQGGGGSDWLYSFLSIFLQVGRNFDQVF